MTMKQMDLQRADMLKWQKIGYDPESFRDQALFRRGGKLTY
jgi:hypothetical protein